MKRVPQSSHPDDDQLQALLWDELDEIRAVGVRTHLEGCTACREAYEELREFAAVAGLSSDPRALEAGHFLAEAVVARARADRWRTTAATALAASLVLATAGAIGWNASRPPAGDEVLAQVPTVSLRSGLRATTKVSIPSNVQLLRFLLVPPSPAGDRLYDLETSDEAGRIVLVITRLKGRGDRVVAVVPADTFRSGGFFRLTLTDHEEPPGSASVSFDIEAISD